AHDLHIKFCLFSFDNFETTGPMGDGVIHHGMAPIVSDDRARSALIHNVVVPIVTAIEQDENADRVVAWDLMNEPEWASHGDVPHGGPPMDPQGNLQTVPFATMERFLAELATAVHAISPAPVTVGSAAAVWARAWTRIDLDFFSFHMYGWTNTICPY